MTMTTDMATPEEVRRLIALVNSDPVVRDEVRRAILTNELIALPGKFTAFLDVVTKLANDMALIRADVTGLRADVTDLRAGQEAIRADVTDLDVKVTDLRAGQEAIRADVTDLRDGQEAIRSRIGSMEQRFGATVEDEAEDAVRRALGIAGYEILGEAFNVDLGQGELDVVFRVRNADGRDVVAIAEAKVRLSPSVVHRLGDRVRSSGFQDTLSGVGIYTPYLVYLFGERVERSCADVARSYGIGLLKYTSEDPIVPAELIEAAD